MSSISIILNPEGFPEIAVIKAELRPRKRKEHGAKTTPTPPRRGNNCPLEGTVNESEQGC